MLERFIGVFTLSLGLINTGQAHHSLAAHYDLRNIQKITGTVVSFQWRNPHVLVVLDVQNEQGEVERWEAEAGSINTLNRTGVSRDIIKEGATVTLVGPVSRFGRSEVLAAKLLSAGTEYSVFPAITNAVFQPTPESGKTTLTTAAGYEVPIVDAPDIFGVWAPVVFPATGIIAVDLPLTESAQVAVDAYDPAAEDLANQCLPAGMPSLLDQPYPIEFIDEGNMIRMRIEEWEGERTIYMSGDAADQGPATLYGYSNGRWEGETLVIVTSGMDYAFYNDAGAPLTADMVVTERYTIDEERHRMNWTATTVDPNVFTEPVTMGGWMIYAPDLEIESFECAVG